MILKKIYKKDVMLKNKANRDKYTILEFKWSNFSEFEKKQILTETDILYKETNSLSANTGLIRSPEKKYIDSLSGIMAEFATTKFFNDFLNENWSAIRPIFESSKNQIDIALNYKEEIYNVEVRSSFVKNGINFALYATNNQGKTYFDVLGTYKQNSYKSNFESVKDLFIRVLFDISDENFEQFYKKRHVFIDKYINKDEPFYVIGGMSGKSIIKKGYKKTLVKKDLSSYSSNIKEGEYNVAEISNIYDIEHFMNL